MSSEQQQQPATRGGLGVWLSRHSLRAFFSVVCPPQHAPSMALGVGAAEDVFTTACGQQRCGSDGEARARRGKKPGSPHRCLPHPVSWPGMSSPSFSPPDASKGFTTQGLAVLAWEESNAHITSWWKHWATRQARHTDARTTTAIRRLTRGECLQNRCCCS